MINTIFHLLVRCLRTFLPDRFYFLLRNVFRIFKIDHGELAKAIKLIDKNEVKYQLIVDEFERHKKRAIIVDGKLNYLLYGKVNDKSGNVDQKIFLPYKTQDEIDFNIEFTVFLRGTGASLRKRYHDRVSNLVQFQIIDKNYLKEKSYLDLGAGNGNVTVAFQSVFEFSKVIGVDSYNNHFDVEELSKAEYVSTDVVSFLTFTNSKVHFISAVHLLEHLNLSDQYYFLKKCYDILEVGGYLYIEMPNIYNYRTLADNFWADEQHLRPFPMSAFRVLIQKLGFEPYFGVYDSTNNFIALDKYLEGQQYFDNKYADLFLSLRKI